MTARGGAKTFEGSEKILKEQGFEVAVLSAGEYYGVENVKKITATEGLRFASVYYCSSRKDAALCEVLYNIYLDYLYNSHMCGFKNLVSLYYGLETELATYPEYESEIDWDLLEEIGFESPDEVFGGSGRYYEFPNIYLPASYGDYRADEMRYTPQLSKKAKTYILALRKY